MSKQGVLLLNLGTPDHCDSFSILRYLREFLLDPRVIDLPAVLRWPLVNLFILPLRYKKVTLAYQKIWLKEGSPLLVNTQRLCAALTQQLGPQFQVEFGMRYGKPSIAQALTQLKGCHSLIVLPLFPQYSSAATGSALQKALTLISNQWNIPEIKVIRDFYQDTKFISAYAKQIMAYTESKAVDCILFSYHGLPGRHINKSNCHANCNRVTACPVVDDNNAFCYRAQCYATTQAIAKQLTLNPDKYTVSFQSRLGRTPWIQPYTDLLLPELYKKGNKNIAIVAPSFVGDCLETLEEIDIRLREQWRALGGDEFIFIPCLNDSHAWVVALSQLIKSSH